MLTFFMIVLNKLIVLLSAGKTSMSSKFCESIHNMAFVMTDNVGRSDMLYATVGFVSGLMLGISVCSLV